MILWKVSRPSYKSGCHAFNNKHDRPDAPSRNEQAKQKKQNQMNHSIRKAVLPVAGLGTRFLPATKAMPKEMLPIVDRPVIEHVVAEARHAGIEHFVFVTGRNKGVIEDHFDRQFELEATLRHRKKTAELEALERDLPQPGQFSFTRQQSPDGLGHAVWCARDLIGKEPFALLLPDVITTSDVQCCLGQLVDVYAHTGGNVIALSQVPAEETEQYGIADIKPHPHARTWAIADMLEKPARGTAPSNYSIMGRYILQPEIFDCLATQTPGAGNEIQLTDAMKTLLETQPFYGVAFAGKHYDCGTKRGFLEANMALALARTELRSAMLTMMQKHIANAQQSQ